MPVLKCSAKLEVLIWSEPLSTPIHREAMCMYDKQMPWLVCAYVKTFRGARWLSG